MAKFLWACWDGGGNLPPSLGVARALAERGHAVLFAGRPEMVGRVAAAGFAARELTQSYALLDRYAWHPLGRVFGYVSSPAVGEELVSVAREEAPDAVVIDAMFGAALAEAEKFDAPTAAMCHTFFSRIFAPWSANLTGQSEGRVRSGFAPLPPVDQLWGARDLVQVNTLAGFDRPGSAPYENIRHGAPVLEEERRAIEVKLPWSDEDRPLVLVSFSTVPEQRSPAMLQRALDALAPLPVRVVATTGDIVDPAELSVPDNAVAWRFAAHGPLMRRASLVLTHGGHGTAMRSLQHGLPMVCVPALAHDQPFVGAAIEEWGAGRALPADAALADIRAAVETVLADGSCRARAQELASELAGKDGATLAAASLETLV